MQDMQAVQTTDPDSIQPRRTLVRVATRFLYFAAITAIVAALLKLPATTRSVIPATWRTPSDAVRLKIQQNPFRRQQGLVLPHQ